MKSGILNKIGQIYTKALEGIGAVIIILVSIAMLEMAFSRTIFNTPWSALDRINTIAIVWACFLVSGVLVERDEHISVNFLITKLSGIKYYLLKLLIHLIVLITYGLIAYYGFEGFLAVYETGIVYPAEVDIPQWLAILPISIGMIVGIPFVIHVLVVDIISIRNIAREKKVKGENK
jgi:TRAP-type C4-dicarboxylate transport system permease small subunit